MDTGHHAVEFDYQKKQTTNVDPTAHSIREANPNGSGCICHPSQRNPSGVPQRLTNRSPFTNGILSHPKKGGRRADQL